MEQRGRTKVYAGEREYMVHATEREYKVYAATCNREGVQGICCHTVQSKPSYSTKYAVMAASCHVLA
jgi:hypothetical protein